MKTSTAGCAPQVPVVPVLSPPARANGPRPCRCPERERLVDLPIDRTAGDARCTPNRPEHAAVARDRCRAALPHHALNPFPPHFAEATRYEVRP